MQRQLELHIVCHEWEEMVTEDDRQPLQSALTEMLRAYFREILGKERSASDGWREDSSRP